MKNYLVTNESQGLTVAIIPARGGSKRIPKKNIRLFAGKPIIAYSIEAANKTRLFNHIIVSTDSSEIADVAIEHGANVPFLRPPELSDDFTATAPVLLHALEWVRENLGKVDHICCIYPTAPFLSVGDLLKSYSLIRDKQTDSVFSVTTFSYPIFRALKIDDGGYLRMIWTEHINSRSQDLPESYHDAGMFYWLNANKFAEKKAVLTDNSIGYILPRYRVQDIDTEEDWKNAELMFKALSFSFS